MNARTNRGKRPVSRFPVILWTAAVFAFVGPSFLAAPLGAQIFDFVVSGEFVAFHDTRGGIDFTRAYLLYRAEDELYVCIRNIDRTTNEALNYVAVIEEHETNGLELVEVHGRNESDDRSFTQSIPDLLNFIEIIDANFTEIGLSTELDDPWEDFYQVFHTGRALPGFLFDSIALNGSDDVWYRLELAGKFTNRNIDVFWTFTGIDRDDYPGRGALPIVPLEPFEAELYDHVVTLDTRWVFNDSFGSPGYWLPRYSERDSQIALERIDLAQNPQLATMNPLDFLRLAGFGSTSFVFMDTYRIEVVDGVYYQSFYMLDGYSELNFAEYRVWIEDGYFFILNFSTFADVYDANREYYRAILDSFRPKPTDSSAD